MTKVNFAAVREKAQEAGLLNNGGVFNKTLKNGDNRFRLVSECLEHPGTYNGKPTFKWLCLVLDRVDGLIKPYFMPNTVYEQIETLQLNPDYKFDEVPMPYDLTLNIRGVKTMEVEYKIIAARQNIALTQPELTAIEDAGSVRDVQRDFQLAAAEKENGGVREATISADTAETPTPARYGTVPEEMRPKAVNTAPVA
jgi:hypothetical protein